MLILRTLHPAFAFALFAGTCLILAAIGACGVLAYAVVQRTLVIGVRMALGAQRSRVLRSFLVQGMRWAAIGGVAGFLAAFLPVRFMRSCSRSECMIPELFSPQLA
jgi:ABC-type antimicrobial peptide transport system permease subunit